MASRFAPAPPPPEHHPPFVPASEPTGADDVWVREHQTLVAIMRQALVDAFDATPWDHAIVLRVRREDFPVATHAVNILAGPKLALRVYVTVGKMQAAHMRVMRGAGAKHRSCVLPWGDPPERPPLSDEDAAGAIRQLETGRD